MVEIIRLENNATLVLEQIEGFQSVSVGFFVEAGSRYETLEQAGISHYVEHMLFKGTETRTAAEIARAFDRMGGQVNAYTSKEITCFYAKTLDYHAEQAMQILGEMLLRPKLDEGDMNTERGVILEEINMVEDSPDDLVVERLLEAVWGKPGLGSPILGVEETVSSFQAQDLRWYMKEQYGAGNIVVSVAGRFDREVIVACLRELLGPLPATPRRGESPAPVYRPCVVAKEKDIEQNHLCYGFPAYGVTDRRATALSLVSHVLGDGMSSRLFQRLREQLGLVYTVSTFVSSHRGCGVFSLYAAQQAESEEQAMETIGEELALLRRDGVTEEELARAKELMKTGVVMSFESSAARMSFNARDYLRHGRIRTADELLRSIDEVNETKLQEVIEETFDEKNRSLSVVGRLRKGGYR
ncbi:MAG: insulinase family protein [Clostridia bacterium]|nr:insulinase family protein [Clostridia bacterium]